MAVEKTYEFEWPRGKVSLLDLFRLPRAIVYHALFEPGVFGWPEHAGAATDQVSHLSHLNARDATLAPGLR